MFANLAQDNHLRRVFFQTEGDRTTRLPKKQVAQSRAGLDVVMLTTVHKSTDVRIFHREAKTLARAGLSVCILGPNCDTEQLDGILIEPLNKPVSRIRRFFLGKAVLRRCLRLRARLYVFHDPELMFVGILLRCFGKKVVYDCHENVPMQVLGKSYIPRPLRWLLVFPVWATLWLGSRILSGNIAATESILKRLPVRKSILVRNYPPVGLLPKNTEVCPLILRRNILIYAGGLSADRGIGELQEAFRGLVDIDVELWLVGPFYDRHFQQQIVSSLPPNVKWLGPRPYCEVLSLFQSAKLGILLHHDTPGHKNALPVKIFEYLGSGLPVIVSTLPQLTEIVKGCGIQVDPLNVVQIRNGIRSMLSDSSQLNKMSDTGRERVRQLFSWENEGEQLVQFCSTVMSTL